MIAWERARCEAGAAVNGAALKAPIYFPMQPRPWLSSGCFSAEIWEMQTTESFLFSPMFNIVHRFTESSARPVARAV